MKKLSTDQVLAMIIHCCDKIVASKDFLTEVDSAIGDGDHGIGMSGGMDKAKATLKEKAQFADINSIFKVTGMSLLNSMGGASGVIFGLLFLGGIKDLMPVTELDTSTLALIMRGSLNSIQERGKAQVGDKTMVDALAPAVETLEACGDAELTVSLRAASEAAKQGFENTKNYLSKFGRSRYLGERALGHGDAGAASVAIIFDAMSEYVNQLQA